MAGKRQPIIDASAIVAVLSEKDQWHKLAASVFRESPTPFLTCESVISETCFLLNNTRRNKVIGLLSDAIIQIEFSLSDEIEEVQHLMAKYDSVPMSLADACLVRMSEIQDTPVFTFDRDFLIYRRNARQKIPLVGLES